MGINKYLKATIGTIATIGLLNTVQPVQSKNIPEKFENQKLQSKLLTNRKDTTSIDQKVLLELSEKPNKGSRISETKEAYQNLKTTGLRNKKDGYKIPVYSSLSNGEYYDALIEAGSILMMYKVDNPQ